MIVFQIRETNTLRIASKKHAGQSAPSPPLVHRYCLAAYLHAAGALERLSGPELDKAKLRAEEAAGRSSISSPDYTAMRVIYLRRLGERVNTDKENYEANLGIDYDGNRSLDPGTADIPA